MVYCAADGHRQPTYRRKRQALPVVVNNAGIRNRYKRTIVKRYALVNVIRGQYSIDRGYFTTGTRRNL